MLMRWFDLEVGDKIKLTEDMCRKCGAWAAKRTGILTIQHSTIDEYCNKICIDFTSEDGVRGIVELDKNGNYYGAKAFEIIELGEN